LDDEEAAMKINQLRYFLVLAEELHFVRAAARLNVSQPPLSRQIQALEHELGLTLFVRGNQRVSLTEAGASLYSDLKETFAGLDRAVVRAKGVARGEAGRIALGMTGSVSFGVMPGILERFHSKFPLVRMEILHLIKADQMQALAARRISLGLTRSAVHTAQIASEVIHQEPFIAALHESHPLARQKSVALEKLEHDNFVLYRGNSWPSVADEIIGLCATAGFSPNIDQDTGEMQTAVSLVAAGLGVTVVADCIRSLLLPRVVYRPLTVGGKIPTTKLHAIYRKDETSTVVKAFLRLARSMGQRA
jgi:LysR family transcriptional regulator, benzoate and cis,cis-muconate-responsive activator of ben and cat genes